MLGIVVDEAGAVVEDDEEDDWEGFVAVVGMRRFGRGRMGRVTIREAGRAYSAGD